MSRVSVRAIVTVYEDDDSEWGKSNAEVKVETYWNDASGQYAVIEVAGRRYTVVANDLRAALNAVTTR